MNQSPPETILYMRCAETTTPVIALVPHHSVTLSPDASRSELSSSLVDPTVKPSNTACNIKMLKVHTLLMSSDCEYCIARYAMQFAAPMVVVLWVAEHLQNQTFEGWC